MPMRGQLKLHRAFVQQPQHDAFAMDHGDHRNADVDLAAADLQAGCGRPGAAAFGNIQPGHDLQAADDGGLKAVDFRRHRLDVEHAVDAVADPQTRLLRFEVHVAGPQVDASRRISLTSRTTEGSWANSDSSASSSIGWSSSIRSPTGPSGP